jgi:hypothetical protein
VAVSYRLDRIVILPGASADIPITNLLFNVAGKEKAAYWTAPGEYTLTATLTSKYWTRIGNLEMGSGPWGRGDLKLTTEPATITVTGK